MTYAYIMDNVRQRLNVWSVKNLSMAGRLTLLQSVLEMIPSYAIQTTVFPAALCDELDKLTRKFLWGASGKARRFHSVSWDRVCKPKEEGGLGLKSAHLMNQAYLIKLGWRLVSNSTTLWSRILCAKYLRGSEPDFRKSRLTQLSPLWKGILRNT